MTDLKGKKCLIQYTSQTNCLKRKNSRGTEIAWGFPECKALRLVSPVGQHTWPSGDDHVLQLQPLTADPSSPRIGMNQLLGGWAGRLSGKTQCSGFGTTTTEPFGSNYGSHWRAI